MNRYANLFSRQLLVVAASLLLLAAPGCTSKSSEREQERTLSGQYVPQAKHLPDPGTADFCLDVMSQNPTAPVHFSYKKNSSDKNGSDVTTLNYEGDVTPTSLDYTINKAINGEPFSNKVHVAPDDKSGWMMGTGGATHAAAPWEELHVFAKTDARPAGPETVNGFESMKYLVDTANEDATAKHMLASGMNLKDYSIVGTAWMLKDANCIVKYLVDYSDVGKDGMASKIHFEGELTRR